MNGRVVRYELKVAIERLSVVEGGGGDMLERGILGVTILALIAFFASVFAPGMPGYRDGITQPLAAVSRALTPEEATANLDRCLAYARSRGLTHGTTALMFPAPEQDIGAWYNRLAAAREQVSALDGSADLYQRTLVLVNVRQIVENAPPPIRLVDHGHEWLAPIALLVACLGLAAWLALNAYFSVLKKFLVAQGLVEKD